MHKLAIRSLDAPIQGAIQQKTRTQTRRLANIHPCQAVQPIKTKNHAQTNEPPGGTCIPARRFLGRILENAETAHIR